eukprot:TRINITY_DN73_c0_g1_i4.p1 TRINITY_DN73_c0_g1~~TRINITY_DN73_c0_g1_i4.p1  ORF type:complete len:407 (+),score=158.46 TRINITY_DN73_c0_g1_i4:99-1223(+)
MSAPLIRARNSQDPMETIQGILMGYSFSKAVAELCYLGVPDLLKKHGPLTSEELVEHLAAPDSPMYSSVSGVPLPDFLYRTLRSAANVGVVDEIASEDGRKTFGHNSVTDTICSDHPLSARWYFACSAGNHMYDMYCAYSQVIRTGKGAPEILKGYPSPFEWFNESEVEEEVFHRSMKQLSAPITQCISKMADFSRFSTIADIGAGRGHLTRPILEAYPSVKVISFDLPHIVQGTMEANQDDPIMGDMTRVEYMSGSYLDWVPESDAYLLSRIIHDLNDDKAVALLIKLEQAMQGEDGRIFIVDIVMPDFGKASAPENSMKFYMDTKMMIVCDAIERTQDQFCHLFNKSGLELVGITQLPNTTASLLEVKKASV